MMNLKPRLIDVLKLIIHNTKKEVVTSDNRNSAYELYKIKYRPDFKKPIPRKLTKEEVIAFKKRKLEQ